MGFLSNLFGRGNIDNSNDDFAFYERLIESITISDTLRSELKIDIKQALENPKSFYDDNNDYILSERGLTYTEDAKRTVKFVLIDTLQDNGEMAEVDWDEEEYEIRILLNEMRIAKNYDFTITDDDLYEGKTTEEIIKLIDERELQTQGYTIELLDIDSDSYVFTIVPLDIKQEVNMMFKKLP